jgi:predicted dehydrogenase
MKKLLFLSVLFSLGVGMGFAQAPKIRIAIIGLDHDHVWGKLNAFASHSYPDAELVAIADPHAELIEKAKTRNALPDVRYFSDYTEMLDQMKPDAVLVTTANDQHLAILRACAQRHIHFLTEKPMAQNGADAREMARVAKEADIKLMVNYPTVWQASTQEAYMRLKSGELGPVQKIIVEFGHQGPREIGASKEFNAWLYDPLKNGAGALMDFGCYGANWALWVKGRPQRVYAYSLKLKTAQHNEVEDDVTVVLEYPDATAILLPSWDWPYGKLQAEFYGPYGGLTSTGDSLLFQAAGKRTDLEKTLGEKLDMMPVPPEKADGTAYFLDCIRHNKPIEGPVAADLNVGVNEIIDAALESIRTGRAVALKP